jgi:hypothetical protein
VADPASVPAVFTKNGVEEILDLLQPKGGKGKPYQVKQVRDVILKYHLYYCFQNWQFSA